MNEAQNLCEIRIFAFSLAAWATYDRVIHNASNSSSNLREAPRGVTGPRISAPIQGQKQLITDTGNDHYFAGLSCCRFSSGRSGTSILGTAIFSLL